MEDFEFNFIELPKFDIDLSDCDSTLKKWIYVIKNASDFSLIPKEYENIKVFKMAFSVAEKHKWRKKELKLYDDFSMKRGINKNQLDTAEAKGVAKGLAEGLAKGEKIKAVEIAKNLISLGLDNQQITSATQLTEQEIQDLRSRTNPFKQTKKKGTK